MPQGESYTTTADEYGELISINLNGTTYYYLYDGIGQIVGLIDETGTQVVKYSYNGFGTPKECLYNQTTSFWKEQPIGTLKDDYSQQCIL